jgi:hypothetical protein
MEARYTAPTRLQMIDRTRPITGTFKFNDHPGILVGDEHGGDRCEGFLEVSFESLIVRHENPLFKNEIKSVILLTRDFCETRFGCNLPHDRIKKCDGGHKILFAEKIFFGGCC